MQYILNQCFSTLVLCVHGTLSRTRLSDYLAIPIVAWFTYTRQQVNSSELGAFYIHFMPFSVILYSLITFYPFSYFMNIDCITLY